MTDILAEYNLQSVDINAQYADTSTYAKESSISNGRFDCTAVRGQNSVTVKSYRAKNAEAVVRALANALDLLEAEED